MEYAELGGFLISFTKMNLNLKVFIDEIMHQKLWKNGIYLVNVDEYKSIGVHWIDLYVNNNSMTYFDRFSVEHIKKKL